MCGLAGFLTRDRGRGAEELGATLNAMTTTIVNRGPDDDGVFIDSAAGVALGFRRLAIVDLTPEGHQPMQSESGRYVIVFNGEVYNFPDLRAELEALGHRFRGHSDTEVMLAAITEWGVEAAVRRFAGMFAFALWDKQEQRLWLGRDRFGKKPMYYGWCGRTFLFGSELKALRIHPDFDAEVDRSAVALFLRFGYVPSPHSIYRGIAKLPPGSLLSIAVGATMLPAPKQYWSAYDAALAGQDNPFRGSDADAVEELDGLLRDSVRMRMISDVPLGAFLSGGIDSSLVVALMCAQSSGPVKTFSIGFSEAEFNEAQYAMRVAKHLGTDHTELYVSPQHALAVVPKLPRMFDEPFADPSQIPTFLVSELARRDVTVALSGDGGDEVFGGYNRYFWAERLWRLFGWMPRSLRRAGAAVLNGRSRGAIASVIAAGQSVLPRRLRVRNPGDKLQKVSEMLRIDSAEDLYARLVYHWRDAFSLVSGAETRTTALDAHDELARIDSFVQRMMYLDTVTYLPDDILVKVDRATMAVSLEGRAPLLDSRVYEFAWRLPLHMKIRDGRGKWALRQVLRRYVPDALIERPKMGFGVPLASWLRGPLRDWAESLLDAGRLEREGFLAPGPIRAKWEQHLRGEQDWQYYLWDVLMFQAWLEDAAGQRSAVPGAPLRLVARA
jgi:asparagine synthase (glutamine-hydrolysing)